MPYHRQGETPDYEVKEYISNSIPTIELGHVNTTAVFDGFVPVEFNRVALEDCNKSTNEEVKHHNRPHNCQKQPEPAYNPENAVVEENEGRFD